MVRNQTFTKWLTVVPVLLAVSTALAQAPSAAPAADRAFIEKVNLDKFRLIAVQHQGVYKTFDTLARSSLRIISADEKLKRPLPDGRTITQEAAFTYLDLLFNPGAYTDVRMIYVKQNDVCGQIVVAAKGHIDQATRDAILEDKRVSLAFLNLPEVRAKLQMLARDNVKYAKHVEQVENSADFTVPANLRQFMRIIPPSMATTQQDRWYSIADLVRSSLPADAMHAGASAAGGPLGDNMDPVVQSAIAADWTALEAAWLKSDATAVNKALDSLAERLAKTAPQIYPAQSKLSLEHWYYKYNKMMWTWGIYLVALVFLLMGVVYRWPTARRIGTISFGLAFAFHTFACGLRWYLAGRIPNSNMFEAVTAAAWLSAALAIVIELGPWVLRKVSPGTAFRVAGLLTGGGFVAWLGTLLIQGTPIAKWQEWGALPIAALLIGSVGCACLISLAVTRRMERGHGLVLLCASATGMVALMCGQFMKVSLDSDIGRTMPVLNDIWLYVHTNMIIASYGIIGMACVTASLFLVGRMLTTPLNQAVGLWLSMLIPAVGFVPLARVIGIPAMQMMSAWAPFLAVLGMFLVALIPYLLTRGKFAPATAGSWADPSLSLAGVGVGGSSVPMSTAAARAYSSGGSPGSLANPKDDSDSLSKVLDTVTMLLLELSFIMLWTGIIMGAKWADHSWGRPWGWDPKEVFALNTWIIFLILVHVRLKVKDRELWTAILTVWGTSVMMFNWVVVNFYIVGLHSYA